MEDSTEIIYTKVTVCSLLKCFSDQLETRMSSSTTEWLGESEDTWRPFRSSNDRGHRDTHCVSLTLQSLPLFLISLHRIYLVSENLKIMRWDTWFDSYIFQQFFKCQPSNWLICPDHGHANSSPFQALTSFAWVLLIHIVRLQETVLPCCL